MVQTDLSLSHGCSKIVTPAVVTGREHATELADQMTTAEKTMAEAKMTEAQAQDLSHGCVTTALVTGCSLVKCRVDQMTTAETCQIQ